MLAVKRKGRKKVGDPQRAFHARASRWRVPTDLMVLLLLFFGRKGPFFESGNKTNEDVQFILKILTLRRAFYGIEIGFLRSLVGFYTVQKVLII